jgi:hypothetical protein
LVQLLLNTLWSLPQGSLLHEAEPPHTLRIRTNRKFRVGF